ncbi:unnamed protein product [Protopolystoma xenopodis]|uniref:Secreted protein n=1 Tax=Protopolystoma xenopodis TaxID=117903 RepID=A0A448XDL4_9PLAT|nr:unnamed protein product [Protopolystoma xenopodis]
MKILFSHLAWNFAIFLTCPLEVASFDVESHEQSTAVALGSLMKTRRGGGKAGAPTFCDNLISPDRVIFSSLHRRRCEGCLIRLSLKLDSSLKTPDDYSLKPVGWHGRTHRVRLAGLEKPF